MWERLIEEYGQETIADLVKANRSQDLTTQGMQLVNALWDNRNQIQVESRGLRTSPGQKMTEVRKIQTASLGGESPTRVDHHGTGITESIGGKNEWH
jgi:hypothetical protein